MAPYLSSYFSKFVTFLGNIPHFKWNYNLYTNHGLLNINSVLDNCILPRYLGTNQLLCSQKKFEPIGRKGIERHDGTMVKVKTKVIPQITLLDENGSISVVTMESARKLAERRNLKLVNVTHTQENKSDRPVYQLQTGAEGFLRRDDTTKGKTRKLLMINSSIAEHDLNTKIKIIHRSVVKDHEMRVILTDDDRRNNLDNVYNYMESNLKDVCRFTNKNIVGNKLTFHAEPLKVKSSSKENKSNAAQKKEAKSEVADKMKIKEEGKS